MNKIFNKISKNDQNNQQKRKSTKKSNKINRTTLQIRIWKIIFTNILPVGKYFMYLL